MLQIKLPKAWNHTSYALKPYTDAADNTAHRSNKKTKFLQYA